MMGMLRVASSCVSSEAVAYPSLPGHLHVQEDDLGPLSPGRPEAFLAAARAQDLVTGIRKEKRHDIDNLWIIVYHKHPRGLH